MSVKVQSVPGRKRALDPITARALRRIVAGDNRVPPILYLLMDTLSKFSVDPRLVPVYMIERGIIGERVCDFYLSAGGSPMKVAKKICDDCALSVIGINRGIQNWN